MVRNLRLEIAYDGSAYAGWQIQTNAPTVQAAIEARLAQITQRPCRLRVAGRTDAGVHAAGQIANFLTESAIPLRGLLRGMNALLPPDIGILSVEEVALDFDSRRHNQGKRYRYSIWNQRAPSPALRARTYHLHRPLDVAAMAAAARHLVGSHDFSAFRAADCTCKTTQRTLYRCTVSQEGALIAIVVEGTAFLKNMVRIIAGTLLAVGQGARGPESIPTLLASRDRTQAGVTLPPHGLCLERVFLDSGPRLARAIELTHPAL
jgi:tRNA pseudouridine38-40 synthase